MRCEAKISIFGHVGQDPKKPSDKYPDFITFSLAVTQSWKTESGEKQEHTDWYEVTTSQKGLSGIVSSYVKKGDPVYVEGAPKYGIYTSKDGEVKPKVNINLTKIVLLGQAKTDEENVQSTAQGVSQQRTHSNVTAGIGSMKDSLDDEIPF